MHSAKSSVALHWCWVTAQLCTQRITIGVLAMTQACCQLVLQSSTEQWGIPTVQCSSEKQARSRQDVTAVTAVEICSSYRCAVTQQKCTAALFKVKSLPCCSVLLCSTGHGKLHSPQNEVWIHSHMGRCRLTDEDGAFGCKAKQVAIPLADS